MNPKSRLLNMISIVVILTTILSSFHLPTASAQRSDGIRREFNAETGKVSFIGAETGNSVAFAEAMGLMPGALPSKSADPAMALAKRFAPEFGLRDAERNLTAMTTNKAENGRLTVRYQQKYQRIPVMGGELIVNTNNRGELYSINGEVSPNLALSTQPTIDSAQAKQIALEAMAKWTQTTPQDFVATEPELWIFDESLLQPSTRPATLVWRMDVSSADGSLPIRELVLINAQTGNPDFHFNQIDTAWHSSNPEPNVRAQDDVPSTETPTPEPIETPIPTETPAPTESLVPTPTSETIVTDDVSSGNVTGGETIPLSGTTWYVATTGNDTNPCNNASTPCLNINSVLKKPGFSGGDVIYVAEGTYVKTLNDFFSAIVSIEAPVSIIGGWDSSFTTQGTLSIIDGEHIYSGIVSSADNVVISKILIKNAGNYQVGLHNGGELLLSQVAIIDNNGIGLYNSGNLTIENTTISKNQGSGLQNSDGNVEIRNSSITDNKVTHATTYGGGIRNTSGTVTLSNSIVSGNVAPQSPNCYATESIVSNGNNIIGNITGCNITAKPGDKFNTDPLLLSLLPMGYQPIAPGSPAINSGNLTNCTQNDQRGVARLTDGKCDIGAYEYRTPTFATKLVGVNTQVQRTLLNTEFPNELEIAALDDYGTPVGGVNIDFSAPTSGPTATFEGSNIVTVVTFPTGYVTLPLRANDQYGDYQITASASGLSNVVSFHLHNGAWLVSSTRGSDSNDCLQVSSPCASLKGVLDKKDYNNNEHIWFAAGNYSTDGISYMSKEIKVEGGWNEEFSDAGGATWLGVGFDVTGSAYFERIVISGQLENLGTIILKNLSMYHGYIWNHYSGHITMQNVTISDSSQTAIRNDGGFIRIENSTITKNQGVTVGGIQNYEPGIIILRDSIVAGNIASMPVTYASADCVGIFKSEKNNIIGTLGTYDVGTRDYPCTGNWSSEDHFGNDKNVLPINQILDTVITQDPRTGQYYHKLKFGSRAIDNGNILSCPPTDQIGVIRPVGSGCDIGASEFVPQPIMTLLSGSEQIVHKETNFDLPLRVALRDITGNPAVGVSVTFSAPASGPSVIFADTGTTTTTVFSDSNGIATSPSFTANDQHGIYSVTASAVDFPEQIAFILTNSQTWYVSNLGNDVNSCDTPILPCATLTGLQSKAAVINGDDVHMTQAIYGSSGDSKEIVLSKSLDIDGGWNNSFTQKSGSSIIQDRISIPSRLDISLKNLTIQNAGIGIHSWANLLVENTTIQNNGLSGIENNGQLTIINSTITGNGWTIGTGDGGVYNSGSNPHSTVTIINSTITNNRGSTGGVRNYFDNPPINLQNTIIAGNTAYYGTGYPPDCSGTFVSLGGNLIGSIGGLPSDCEAEWHDSDLVGYYLYSDQGQFLEDRSIDAKLEDVQDIGGNIWVHPLQLGSPAIDGVTAFSCPAIDQRGVSRPQSGRCDIGAYEYVLSTGGTALVLRTFDAENSWELPGTLTCDQTDLTCVSGDADAKNAHYFAAEVYNFYQEEFNRNSLDNNGIELLSAVHYGTGYKNAYWNGYMMIYGDGYGFANADDVVAHELTHGVTQYASGLFYFYQSGAIDESFADLWGEYFDQINGVGKDGNSYDWLIGEDVTGMGAFRSMKNPPQFGDPDKMTSALYNKKPYFDKNWDNGGVHTNSGVNNKAVYLMVDGGTFNNKTVTALGWEKTAAIYYEVNTNLLMSASDYSDLYFALQQACSNLVGQHGITSADCIEVKDAVDAVQMNSQSVANFNPDAPLCPTGMITTPAIRLFQENFENGTNQWNFNSWNLSTMYAAGDNYTVWGDDQLAKNIGTLTMKNGITLPAGSTPFLHFKHAFGFDHYNSNYYDGGVLEYSINNGSTWIDAKPLFSAGQNYKGTVFEYPVAYKKDASALHGQSAFVGDSHGTVSSRYDLKSLAGKTVFFRWRFATDKTESYVGWFVDDISVYKCIGTPSVPSLVAPAVNALLKDYTPLLDWGNATSIDHYEMQLATDNAFTSLVYNETSLSTSQFQVPLDLDSNTKYYWRVRGVNGLGQPGKWTTTRTFRTIVTAPALVSPAIGTPVKELRPLFDWNAPGGPGVISGYTIQIAKDALFKQIIHTGNPISSQYIPTINLPKNMPLHWRVLAKGANGPSAYSEVRSFTTPVNPPPTPVLLSPANNALLTNYENPTLQWKPVTFLDASFQHYQVQVATDMAFSNLVLNDTSITSRSTGQLVTSLTLTPNTKYYWRVRAVNTDNELSNWSALRIIRAAILPPTLLTPDDDSTGVSRKPLLDWENVDGNSGYILQVWKGATLVKSVTLPPDVSQYKFLTNLLPNTVYFWKVQAKAANGPSAWSGQFDFTTGP